jgi:hypothetical protein
MGWKKEMAHEGLGGDDGLEVMSVHSEERHERERMRSGLRTGGSSNGSSKEERVAHIGRKASSMASVSEGWENL